MIRYFIPLLVLFSLGACKNPNTKTIILSKSGDNYVEWMADENTIILDAYTIANTDSILSLADGIILTGGEDINPLFYNDSSNLALCETINHRRDTLEQQLFDYALKHQIPLIGVCRGMQFINIAFGGSLYGDIPSEIGATVIHRKNGEVMHKIALIDSCSRIFPTQKDTFTVNSWHHQGLKVIPKEVQVVAQSYDGLAEAIVIDKKTHPFMIAVQFHPERLGKENAIHLRVREQFTQAMGR